MEKNKEQKAFTLIVTLITLVALSTLGVFFVRFSTLFLNSTVNNTDNSLARMVAQAAIDYAVIQIPYTTMNVGYTIHTKRHQYGAPNTTGNIGIPVDADKMTGAPFPSYHDKAKGKGRYKEGSLDFYYSIEVPVGNSGGKLGITRRAFGTLKLIDTNGLLNLNAPMDKKSPGGDYSFDKMLTNLVLSISGVSSAGKIVSAVRKKRKGGAYKYTRIQELRHLVNDKILTEEQFRKFCSYVTVQSWGDPRSIKPGSTIPEKPDGSVKFETRYPVNVNIAPFEVLVAVISDIKAKTVTGELVEISTENANYVVKRLIKKRPFDTWNMLEEELYKMATEEKKEEGKISEIQATAIFSNVYPGNRLNKRDPDIFHYRKIDKLDILTGTTEFCLFSPGIFRIEAVGRVIENKENLVGKSIIESTVKIWEPRILSTQNDFLEERNWISENDAWTGINARRQPPTSKKRKKGKEDKLKPEADAFGWIFEKHPERDEGPGDHVLCRYFAPESEEKEESFNYPRPDGAHMLTDKPFSQPIDEDDWEDDGFDLWIKPGYKVPNEYVIAEKHEPASAGGYIITRCSYEKDIDSSSSAKYVSLTRTYAMTDANTFRARKYPTRVFYGLPLRNNAREFMMQEGANNIYYIVLGELIKLHAEINDKEMYYDVNFDSFRDEFYRKVYASFGSGHADVQEPKATFEIGWMIIKISPGGIDIQYKKKTVTVWFRIYGGYNTIRVTCPGTCSNLIVNLKHAYWHYVFNTETTSPQIEYNVTRKSVRKEALDINPVPSTPIKHNYRYSRTQYRARIDLEPGHWYHITGRWTSDDMLIEKLTVTTKNKVVDGAIVKRTLGGPMRVWPYVYYEEGTRYRSEECTIYQSTYRTNGNEIKRYRPTGFIGNYECVREEEKSEKDRFIEFGTLNWTCFMPEGKYSQLKLRVAKGDKYYSFLSNGTPKKTTFPVNPFFERNLKGEKLRYHIVLGNSEENKEFYFETSMFKNLTFYFLLKPALVIGHHFND